MLIFRVYFYVSDTVYYYIDGITYSFVNIYIQMVLNLLDRKINSYKDFAAIGYTY